MIMVARAPCTLLFDYRVIFLSKLYKHWKIARYSTILRDIGKIKYETVELITGYSIDIKKSIHIDIFFVIYCLTRFYPPLCSR